MPGARARPIPTSTGGYYQPVRADLARKRRRRDRVRARADPVPLGSIAPTDVAGKYASDYVPNSNPMLSSAVLDPDGTAMTLFTAAGKPRRRRRPWSRRARWSRCRRDWTDGTAEGFLVYDIASHTLVTQREALRLSWFATAGVFLHDRSGRGETETETFTQNVWTAPPTPGLVHLWLVLRDSRGGVDFAEAQIDVQ